MVLGDLSRVYDIINNSSSHIEQTTGLYWNIGGGSSILLWVDFPEGSKLSEKAQAAVIDTLQGILDENAPSNFPVDRVTVVASDDQAGVNFQNPTYRRISMGDFVKLCETIMLKGGQEIKKQLDTVTESKKSVKSYSKKSEGAGAGYEVTIKEMTIAEEPKITYDEAKDVFKVVAPVEYEANAEGYDWGSAYIMNKIMGMDVGTFPYNPFNGELELEIPNEEGVWDELGTDFEDAKNPTIDEKLDVLHSAFYKGKEFEDFSEVYGGGWVHVKYPAVVHIEATPDGYGEFGVDFAMGEDFNGVLTIDPQFEDAIEFSHNYTSNHDELFDAIFEYISDKGLEPTWNGAHIYDYTASYVTDDVTNDYVEEILNYMVDDGLKFYDKNHELVSL